MFHSRVVKPRVHFGGPDQSPGQLRDLLEQRVDEVPPGGSIDWMVYYFRDERLADALIRAHRRGVAVRVCVEGLPRHRSANTPVIDRLKRGIGDGLRVHRRLLGASHLHSKIYCFSAPRPHALVGSFNPSGNEPDDDEIIADIGDQDRGHNVLFEVDDQRLVRAFTDRIAAIHSGANPFGQLAAAARSTVAAGREQAFFFPRRGKSPLERQLEKLGPKAKLRIAASHIRDRLVAWKLADLARRGTRVEVLTHHTRRRSPERLIKFLRDHGVATYRYHHPEDLPMHAKFILAEDGVRRWSAFGSYNLTLTSRRLNQELLAISTDKDLWRALDSRWHAIMSEPWCKH